MKKVKLDWNDITIVPEVSSEISSRSEINPFTENNSLPIFTAPMDTVIDEFNYELFLENKINVCLPRHIKDLSNKSNKENLDNVFFSYGLDEIEDLIDKRAKLPKKVLIDVANGHMKRLMKVCTLLKFLYGDKIELMAGNIANPETYRKYCEIGLDYVRVGIGSGSACTTSANASIHYPMASLVKECSDIAKKFNGKHTKIVADGGFKNYSDIIKALALGADYVMLGGIFSKCLESCSSEFIIDNRNFKPITREESIEYFKSGKDIYKYYRGMSTKEVQKFWNKKKLTTGEGISKYNKVEYELSSWVDNFKDYLKSTMSYCGSLNLQEFIGEAQWVVISQMAFNRFNK